MCGVLVRRMSDEAPSNSQEGSPELSPVQQQFTTFFVTATRSRLQSLCARGRAQKQNLTELAKQLHGLPVQTPESTQLASQLDELLSNPVIQNLPDDADIDLAEHTMILMQLLTPAQPVAESSPPVSLSSSSSSELPQFHDQPELTPDDVFSGSVVITRWGEVRPRAELSAAKSQALLERDLERETKWLDMYSRWEYFRTRQSDVLKRRVRKGVPDSMRAQIWPLLVPEMRQRQSAAPPHLFTELKNTSEQLKYPGLEALPAVDPTAAPKRRGKEPTTVAELCYDIRKDIHRTFPTHISFRETEAERQIRESSSSSASAPVSLSADGFEIGVGRRGRESLFHVLKSIAIKDPELGYCQGLGFLVGALLMYLGDEDTFFFALALLSSQSRFSLRSLFMPGFPALAMHNAILDVLFKKQMPSLHKHFRKCDITSPMYSTSWFLTLFASKLPLELVLRIWDILFAEGFKIGLS